MIRVDGVEVTERSYEWGVTFESTDGQKYVIECDDEADARNHQAMFGGTVSKRPVYVCGWVAADE